jgi:predicted ATP-binding protein involved in virulence
MAKRTKKVVAKQGRSNESPEVSPVYFLSLEVENVLCFKDKQVLDLTDKNGNPAQWTVILGDNGVGKTTLLRSLASVTSEPTNALGYITYNRPNLIPSDIPGFIGQRIAITPWLCNLSAGKSQSLSTEKSQGHFLILVEFSAQNKLSVQKDQSKSKIELGKFSIHGLANVSTIFPERSTEALICYGYGAVRNLGSGALSEDSWKNNSLSLFSEGEFLINAEEWMLQTDYGSLSASGEVRDRLKKQITQIFDILKRILPDVEDIKIAPATEDNPHPRAEFLTPYGWVHINSLGLGYRTAIAWMVDLAVRLFRRYPNSPDPLAEPAIVLVDEIDLHLHPRWQRTIMDFLTDRFPNTQFIVTAHSPLVVQAAQNANIVLLRREGDRVVIDNDPEIIKNWRVDQVLTSVFELPSSRPPHIEPLLKRHEAILAKAHLTAKDEAELAKLADQIGPLPTADTPEDIEAMDIIRQAAKLLKNA